MEKNYVQLLKLTTDHKWCRAFNAVNSQDELWQRGKKNVKARTFFTNFTLSCEDIES